MSAYSSADPDDTTLTASAQQAVPIITTMVKAYTRGNGFDDDDPNEELEAVIVTAAARLVTNPGQIPVDQVAGQFTHRWSSPTNTETATEVRDNIVATDVELLAPVGFSVNPYDLIDLPDGQYEVVGRPQEMSYGPFGTDFGVMVKLRRWEA